MFSASKRTAVSLLRRARAFGVQGKNAVPQGKMKKQAPKPFVYQDVFEPVNKVDVPFTKITSDFVTPVDINFDGETHRGVKVEPEGLQLLARTAMSEIAHKLRPGHLEQLSNILKDPEASDNDRFVALELLKNANIAAGMVLPGCQDTGTAIVMGKRGAFVMTNGNDEESLSRGVYDTYTETNLRYSQVAPLNMFEEANTGTNLPAQIELYATPGNEYKFQFMAKGGGSANKTFLFQETKALLNEERLIEFLEEKIKTIGTSACPPYHLAIVIGGLSAEMTLKAVKLASTRYYDVLATEGNAHGIGFRDLETEQRVHQLCRDMGIGAQFGGKYFCHDVRVIRLPRHGASCPVGIGVSCSADRQCHAKINEEGECNLCGVVVCCMRKVSRHF